MTIAAEVAHFPLTQGRVGFVLGAVCLACLLVIWWRLDNDVADHDEILPAHSDHLAAHDDHLSWLTEQVEAITAHLRIVVLPAVADDSPGHEDEIFDGLSGVYGGLADDPVTEPDMPATAPIQRPTPGPRLPATEESRAVIVGGARLKPAAQEAADAIEAKIAEIRARSAKRNALRPGSEREAG